MAEIVGALGVPHNPFVALALARGEDSVSEARRLYGALAVGAARDEPGHDRDRHDRSLQRLLRGQRADLQHRRRRARGGALRLPAAAAVDVALDAELAREIQASVVAEDFDVGASRELELDHTITAPLCSMLGTVDVALIPLYVSGSMHPLPRARRCFALGRAVRRAIERSPLARRVVVVGSGAFSFEVGGPRMSEDSHVGVPDPAWAGARHRAARRRRLRARRGRGDPGTAGGGRQRVGRAPRLARDARHLRRASAGLHRGPARRGACVRRVEARG